MDPFNPALDQHAFRTALGKFPTGVTVVTALNQAVPIGMTANSFASLSLDPALILWSPSKRSSRHDPFVEAEAFNVHVLDASQQSLCDMFTRSQHGFDHVDHAPGIAGVPILAGCLAVFECRKYAAHDAGDHTLILGEVIRCRSRDSAPLVFLDGKFGGEN